MIIETDKVKEYLQEAANIGQIQENDKIIILNFLEMIEAYYHLALAKPTLEKFANINESLKAKKN